MTYDLFRVGSEKVDSSAYPSMTQMGCFRETAISRS